MMERLKFQKYRFQLYMLHKSHDTATKDLAEVRSESARSSAVVDGEWLLVNVGRVCEVRMHLESREAILRCRSVFEDQVTKINYDFQN